jgi:hypothetical protein
MSELEQYVSMLKRANIEFEQINQINSITITIERGYAGFVLNHEFSLTGELIDCGAYE